MYISEIQDYQYVSKVVGDTRLSNWIIRNIDKNFTNYLRPKLRSKQRSSHFWKRNQKHCRCKVFKAYFSLYMMTTMLVNISGAVTKSTKILPWMSVYAVYAIQKHKSYKTHVFLIDGLSGEYLLHSTLLHLAFYRISKKELKSLSTIETCKQLCA